MWQYQIELYEESFRENQILLKRMRTVLCQKDVKVGRDESKLDGHFLCVTTPRISFVPLQWLFIIHAPGCKGVVYVNRTRVCVLGRKRRQNLCIIFL